MKKSQLHIFFLLIAGLSLILTSCEKDSGSVTSNTSIAEDDALATDLFEDVFSEVDDAAEYIENNLFSEGLKSESSVVCKTITIEQPDDTTYWPRTITIDYGEGCTGKNGRTRKGKIIIQINLRYTNEAYYRIVTFDEFYVNDFKIEGTRTLSNEGENENGNTYFSLILENGKLITPEGEEISREYSLIREWVAGRNTPKQRIDDEYMVTGTATGVNKQQIAYSRTISEPLYITRDCRWIRSGIVEITTEDKESIILDYGNGTCDRLATITRGGETKTIHLQN